MEICGTGLRMTRVGSGNDVERVETPIYDLGFRMRTVWVYEFINALAKIGS
jgi:hypothetical protein